MDNSYNSKRRNISLNIIIFSKNRACQLDLLLTSMLKMFREYKYYKTNVLYTTTSDDYELGYSILKKSHNNVSFFIEHDFKSDLLSLVDPHSCYTVFFVDDIVWKEPFSINCEEVALLEKDPDILCASLRLAPCLKYCYALDMDMCPPHFDQYLRWRWDGQAGDFGYPMSLDGHIFRTNEILGLLTALSYKDPNSLEDALSNNPLNHPKMICLDKAPIFNVPINKVQTHNTNRHGNISAEYLNEMYLSGYRILLKPLIGFSTYACHQEVDVILNRSFFNRIWNLF